MKIFLKLNKNIRRELLVKFCIDTGATGSLDCENSPEPLQLTDWHYFSKDFLRLKKNIAILPGINY